MSEPELEAQLGEMAAELLDRYEELTSSTTSVPRPPSALRVFGSVDDDYYAAY